ncbi:peptidylprolyl isomerase [Sphingobium boeckii]|uniref:Parvulin-like PPIase n=1 Tax=Sphingobium boeckii TaxID=1082345 RepID=A0A7W9EFI6_9SPHN|nr:peptidylprolyl isomerase [Sphingobium boeckii]MBB5687363.1 peptidyl-prolyl cis-trans isomerase SurA [Sphingobium boeckii]
MALFQTIRRTRVIGLLVAGSLSASMALAQGGRPAAAPAPAPQPAPNNLNIPANVTVFGDTDPNLYKATARVNGEVITATDIDQRLALVLISNQAKIGPEERERLRQQILRNLIDETLQIQEAKALELEVKKDEVDQRYNLVAQNFKRTPKQMAEYLNQNGSSERSIKRQIESELAWQRVLGRKVTPFINVSEEEVQSIITRLNASKGTKEYDLGEIFISGTPETLAETTRTASQIMQQLQQSGSFAAYARQYSEATTAGVGGRLGWIRAEQLPPQLAEAAQNMQIGQVAGPIPLPGGVSILLMYDERQVLTANARDAVLSLKQLAISFPAGTTQAQASPIVEKFAIATRNIKGCGPEGGAQQIATETKAEMVDNNELPVRDLPPQLQDMLLGLQVGQVTQPFGSLEDGVRVLVLCGRDDPQVANGPSADRILADLEEERTNRKARSLLRDLRRDAVVDYR